MPPKYIHDGRILTLGMFVIDSFKYEDEEGNELGIQRQQQIGGSGTYFIIGARHFLPPDCLGQIIDYNPSEESDRVIRMLKRYEVMDSGIEASKLTTTPESKHGMFYFRERIDGEGMTLGLNVYRGDLRDFIFLTPGSRIWPPDYLSSPYIPSLPPSPSEDPVEPVSYPRYVHFTSSPIRAQTIMNQLEQIRLGTWPNRPFDNATGKVKSRTGKATISDEIDKGKGWNPALIWEVFPAEAIPKNAAVIQEISKKLHIHSPNHHEALSLLGIPEPSGSDEQAENELIRKVERAVTILAKWMYKGPGSALDEETEEDDTWRTTERGIVIRCGHLGACMGQQNQLSKEIELHWIEPFHYVPVEDEEGKVVDVTGGGNAFLGGLAAGLKLGKGLLESCLYASVAASFAIEQDGLPHIDWSDEKKERWNEEFVENRLLGMRGRMGWTNP